MAASLVPRRARPGAFCCPFVARNARDSRASSTNLNIGQQPSPQHSPWSGILCGSSWRRIALSCTAISLAPLRLSICSLWTTRSAAARTLCFRAVSLEPPLPSLPLFDSTDAVRPLGWPTAAQRALHAHWDQKAILSPSSTSSTRGSHSAD